MKRLNIKELLSGLMKRIIKKLLSPKDILFLILTGLFTCLFIYELSSTSIHVFENSNHLLSYILQIKYQLLLGVISLIFFISSIIVWIKHKVKSLLNYVIPCATKKSFHWGLLITTFALNSIYFFLS